MAWIGLRRPVEAGGGDVPEAGDRHRMYEALEVQKVALRLFPGGVEARTSERTAALLADALCPAILYASVETADFQARVHVLQRAGRGWHVHLIKSGFSVKDDYVRELAFLWMVLRRVGVNVTQGTILILARDYLYGDPPERLFHRVDCTDDARDLAETFERESAGLLRQLKGGIEPEAALARICRTCGYFEGDCLGRDVDHTVFELPSLANSRLEYFAANRIVRLADIPSSLILSGRQERVRNAAVSGRSVFEPELAAALEGLTWPCHYLDFETVTAALPLYPGSGCHRQLLTQFSVHHRAGLNTGFTHDEFLADPARDCERDLAEELVRVLGGGEGSIFTYSSFERTCVKALGERFPDLEPDLSEIRDRMVDLLKLVGDHVYHPAFRGSYSIKSVLPALVPDLSYAGMPVADGSTAIMKFAQMARGVIAAEQVQVTRQQLLDYCRMDTYAMVRVHEALAAAVQRPTVGAAGGA